MSDEKQVAGTIAWADLTVENAEDVRDFYTRVVGWGSEGVDMGGYSDFCMTSPEGGPPVAGICHARKGNAGLPAVWLMYVTVTDIDTSVAACEELGGRLLSPIRSYGEGARYCVIEDPAGAALALFQKG
ncbi:MAG TPA: VOC family protein [Thermoanaerobaculia bacterium]